MTEKLYHDNAYLTEFKARVVSKEPCPEGTRVVLDRTCFYPDAGGQPCDTGTLGGARVLSVVEDGGEVVHVAASDPGGPEVAGRIDWDRRFDHMQQHTGQHVLTQCLLQTAQADTVGFAISADHSSIELGEAHVSREKLDEAEDLANRILAENRPVRILWVDRKDLDSLGARARGLPDDAERIRVIDIQDFNRTTCGGTHPGATGEACPIRITGSERIRGRVRIFYVGGRRAHLDHRRKGDLVDRACRELSTGPDDLPAAVSGKLADLKRLSRELSSARLELARHLGRLLFSEAPVRGGVRVVTHRVEGWGMPELTELANCITAGGTAVALLGSGGEKASMVFAASTDSGVDASALMSAAAAAVGGKGGGNAAMSRGGFPDPAKLDQALKRAGELVPV